MKAEKTIRECLSRVDIFKWLLRKKGNKANIYRNEARGKRVMRLTPAGWKFLNDY